MFASRKPLAIVLAVMMIFAMLVPAAMAAPQATKITAVTITWPASDDGTNPSKAALVNPNVAGDPTKADKQGDDIFKAKFKLTIPPPAIQGNDIRVRYMVIDPNSQNDPVEQYETFEVVGPPALVNGVELTSEWLHVSWRPEWKGWYTLQICVQDDETQNADEWVCAQLPNAVFIDSEDPGVELMKPAEDGAVISGKAYVLSGQAWDPADAEDSMIERYGRIVMAWFDYCANPEFERGECEQFGTEGWVKIGNGVRNAVGDTYELTFDSTGVLDGHGAIRFCAVDLVGLVDCQMRDVVFANTFTIELQAGWNLISTPVMLYDADMDNVLFNLTQASKVNAVYGMANSGVAGPNQYTWTQWVPGDNMKLEHGKGYWINMAADGDLEFVGGFANVGPVTPPSYQFFKDWNLIGYTHWGTPSAPHPIFMGDKTVADYIGVFTNSPKLQALWRYDAGQDVYVAMNWASFMVKGAGYWFGVSEGGMITP